MQNMFGRYSLPSVLGRLFHHGDTNQQQPQQQTQSNPFGRYSLPGMLGRLFHHDTPATYPVSQYTGGLDGSLNVQSGSFSMNNIGPPQIDGQLPLSHVSLNGSGQDFGQIQGIGAPRIGGGYQGGSPTPGTQGLVDPSQWSQIISMAYDNRNRIGDTNSTFHKG